MKRLLIILLMVVTSVIATAEVVDKIVAKIGGDIILMSDLQKQMAQMQSSGVKEEMIVPREVLDSMVEQRLMVQKAKDLDIKVDENAIKNYAESYMKKVRTQYPSEAAFAADIAKMRLTQSDLLKYFIEQITDNALTEQLVEKYITTKVKVEEAEMLAFYEVSKDSLAVKPVSWDLRMIMREIKPSEDADGVILGVMNSLWEQLNAGADFATLASETSDCPSSKQGGDLGFFKKGMMVKPFEDAAFALGIGEISQVIKTQFGYHIIKVEEKKGDEIRARHILKTVTPGDNDETREMELMNSIRDQIGAGASFADLASQYSMDTESAADGGLIGEFAAEEFPELFAPAILDTPVGTATEVLKNEGMLYLFTRDKEVAQRLFTFEEVKEQLNAYLFKQKQMQAFDVWMQELKTEGFVSISL